MVIFLSVLVILSLAIAAPKVKQEIQRDRDVELRHRGMQYARAVKLYYKKFGAYPTTVTQLQTGSNLNTSIGFSSSGGTGFDSAAGSSAFGSGAAPNQQKFLRRLYADPVTGKAQWRLVYFGQVGLGGANPNCAASGSTALSGSLSGSGTITPPADPTASPSGTDSTSAADCASSGGLGTPAANAGFSSSGSSGSFGSGSGSGFGSSSGSSFGSSGGSGFGGSSGGDAFGGSFGSAGSTGSGSPGSSFGSGGTGQQLGGGPIVGVASLSRKESIIEIKGKNHYNDLEFVYDPTQDFGGAAGMSGTSVGGATSSPFGTTGQQPGGGGLGTGGGLGSPIGTQPGGPTTPVTTPDPGTGSGTQPQ